MFLLFVTVNKYEYCILAIIPLRMYSIYSTYTHVILCVRYHRIEKLKKKKL